ncbi:MAG: SpoIIE family protein phosphatase [Candidatus Acidoferrales bacterium]
MSLLHGVKWRPRFSVAWGAGISLLGFGVSWLAGATAWQVVFGVLTVVLAVYALGIWRRRLLWRLRNRLLVIYLFIAVIPILLILGMVGLTSYLLYGQLAGYLVATALDSKALQLGAVSEGLVAELQGQAATGPPPSGELRRLLEKQHANLHADYGELTLVLAAGGRSVVVPPGPVPAACSPLPAWVGDKFSGVIASGNRLFLHSAVRIPRWRGATFCLTVPVTADLIARLGADIGRFGLIVLEEVAQRPATGPVFVLGDRTYVPVDRLEPSRHPLPAPRYFFDPVLSSASKFNVVRWGGDSPERQELPVFLTIETRPSLLNQRLFSPLGEVAQVVVVILVVSGVLFLLLELASLITGVRLTRSITASVGDLYAATQRLQRGDFAVRVPHRRDDQLGSLGDSFNQMATSLERLLEESKQRQRLEQELEIARQVQEQLFPRQVPELQTLELLGYCKPARVVSGDYYDYGLADTSKLIFTIGDVSGKGISAALLMATIQSILRSHGYASRLTGQTAQLHPAELVSRINRQLCATTSLEKYSTLFLGCYDDSTRRLTYTNAGHLPPILLGRGRTQELTVGGMVVGLFPTASYEEAEVELQPGDWLVAFTDGVTEVENSYEEEYGRARLLAFLQRLADTTSPERLVRALLAELEQWAPGAEQSDDATVLVARVR